MEYIDRIYYRKITPSDFKNMYDIDRPTGGNGQTYLEAAGISSESIVDFLSFAEKSDSPQEQENRSIYTFNAHVLGNSVTCGFIEFAPRGGRINYKISRQNLGNRHPAWSPDNGFPEPNRNDNGDYTSEGNFNGIIDNLVVVIIRTTYKKYYAGYLNEAEMPDSWPRNIGLERMFEGNRRGVLSLDNVSVVFVNSLTQPFGEVINVPLVEQQEEVTESVDELNFVTGWDSSFPRNRIIFGAPGTGKSFNLNSDKDTLLEDLSKEEKKDCYERVTFHPDYSYAQFVGTYKPVMVNSQDVTCQDKDFDFVIDVLNQNDKTAQEKYDELFERFKSEPIVSKLPVLVSYYTDGKFTPKTKKSNEPTDNYTNEIGYGQFLKKYATPINNINATSGDIAYEYVPGPFMRLYVKAIRSIKSGNPKPYVLIIEEINRANVAAVFGDVFQLLDRGKNNASEYSIQASEDIRRYLAKELDDKPERFKQLCIPDNMFIWATMNSADQGVYPLDTAFKRRWNFEYIGVDEEELNEDGSSNVPGEFVVSLGATRSYRIEWNALRKAINELLSSDKVNVHEDKLLGPFFINTKNYLKEDSNVDLTDNFIEVFENKVLMYIFEDAAKTKRSSVFVGDAITNRFSKLCSEFESKGLDVFAKVGSDKFSAIYDKYVTNAACLYSVQFGTAAD